MDWLTGNWLFREFIIPSLDVLLLAYLIFKTYQILVQTRAIQLIKGALLIGLIYLLAFFLQLNTFLWILNMLVPGLVIAMAIVFQPELRRIFTRIGQSDWFRINSRVRSYHVEAIINSVEILSAHKRGALMVFSRNVGLNTIIETGTRLNAELSSGLILTIFVENTPLHDGAIVISEDKIVAAGCFLPLSDQPDIRRSFGTRHRAALGLAEETDAVILIVSEENGAISLSYDANLLYDLSIQEISDRLKMLLNFREDAKEDINLG